MRDPYLKLKLLVIVLLMLAGMNLDYQTELEIEAARKNPYELFCLPPNDVVAGGGK
jgi:hypothetical protein